MEIDEIGCQVKGFQVEIFMWVVASFDAGQIAVKNQNQNHTELTRFG